MANLQIKTRINYKWVELTITDGKATIAYYILEEELEYIKGLLEKAIEDINYMIENPENE